MTILHQMRNLGINGALPPPIRLHCVMLITSRHKSDLMTQSHATTHSTAISLIATSQHNKIHNPYHCNWKAHIKHSDQVAKKAGWHVMPRLPLTQSSLWNGCSHIASQTNDS